MKSIILQMVICFSIGRIVLNLLERQVFIEVKDQQYMQDILSC